MIECHSSASKSPWHDYVIHELKMATTEGDMGVYGIAVCGFFSCGITVITSAQREVKDSRRSGMYQS